MAAIDELLDHYRKVSVQMRDDLMPLETGRMTMRENNGSGWVDVTQSWIETTKAQISNLENIIAPYERRKT